MKRFLVSSGDLKRVFVKANSALEAASIAVEVYRPKALGEIMEIRPASDPDNDDRAFYCLTKAILEKMGAWQNGDPN